MASPDIKQQPNILMFHVDNVSVGDFGCYGGAYPLGAKTPNIDQFANESLQLTNYNVEAQCTQPLCLDDWKASGSHRLHHGTARFWPSGLGGHDRR